MVFDVEDTFIFDEYISKYIINKIIKSRQSL